MPNFVEEIMKIVSSIDEEFLQLSSHDFSKIFDKKMCYIFGKNGSGKTTISRKISKDLENEYDLFIFNKDYIRNNIFTQDEKSQNIDTQKITVNNKKRTFQIFLGKPLIDLTKKISENEIKKKEIVEDLVKYFSIGNELKDWLTFLKHVKENYKTKDFDTKKIKDEIKGTIKKNQLQTKILKELRDRMSFVELFKEAEMIDKDFNDLIDIIKSQNNYFNSFNLHYQKTSKMQKVIELHESALKFCEPEGYIEFLEKNISKLDLTKYIKNNTNEKTKILQKIKKNKALIKEKADTIKKKVNKNEWTKNLKYIEMLEIIDEILIINNYPVLESSKIEFNFKLYENKKYERKYEEEILKIKEFIDKNWIILIINNYDDIEVKENINKNLSLHTSNKEEKEELKKQKEELQKIFNNSFVDKINKIIKHISKDDFGINLKDSLRNDEHFLELTSKNKNLDFLSEGEKNTLAISYFLVDLSTNYKNIDRNFVIFIDDPFDSNDHFKYDYFHNLKFDIEGEELNINELLARITKSKKINGRCIISTHNINVLSSFMRSLKDSNSASGNELFYKMKHEENIKLVNLSKNSENIATITDLDINLFFPKEDLINKCIDIEFDSKMKNNSFQIYLLICALRVKLLDNYEYNDKREIMEKRGRIKNFIKKNKDYINFNFSFELILEFLKENVSEKNKIYELESLAKYLFFIKDRYEKILKSSDEEAQKRLRHKNNFYSTPIGHIIEE